MINVERELSLAMQLFSRTSYLVYSHSHSENSDTQETIQQYCLLMSIAKVKISPSSLLTFTQKEIHKNRRVFFKPSGCYCERLELLHLSS